jgi:hypothetical protein
MYNLPPNSEDFQPCNSEDVAVGKRGLGDFLGAGLSAAEICIFQSQKTCQCEGWM